MYRGEKEAIWESPHTYSEKLEESLNLPQLLLSSVNFLLLLLFFVWLVPYGVYRLHLWENGQELPLLASSSHISDMLHFSLSMRRQPVV